MIKAAIQSTFVDTVSNLGRYLIFSSEAIRLIFRSGVKRKLLLNQMEFIGVRSFWITLLAAIMIGAVFGIQFGTIFRTFGAESMIGAAASFALSKELAPVITSFLVAGRAGSAIAAEIGNMKVNEQLDAMQVMAVNPLHYLAAPRILAGMIMTPLLTGIFMLTGVISAYIIGVLLFDVDRGIFIDKITWITKPNHVMQGLEKAFVFGVLFSTIGCYKGFHTMGGAKGVGKSTTEAVVLALVSILIVDFFISYMQLEVRG